MPDPKSLKVGDLVRFTELPEEWSVPGYRIDRMTITFMKKMIKRTRPVQIAWIDDWGQPCVSVTLRERGKNSYHCYGITETTGWRLVKRRPKKVKK